MASSWMICFGSGDGTTRRQDPPSGLTTQPRSAASARALLVVDRADELGRLVERGIVGVDEHSGDDGDRVLVVDGVVELELDDVADLPRTLGVEHIERIGVIVTVRVLFEREKPDLWAVAVRDHETRPLGHGAEHLRDRPRSAQLVGGGGRLAAPKQSVTTERDDGKGRG